MLLVAVVSAAAILAVKLRKYRSQYFTLRSHLKKVINTVSEMRYGNLKTRAIKGYDRLSNELSANLNSMFESISDREVMIQEYILKDKEANILKTDFIATLTHDLKVPIIAQDKTFDLFLDGKFGELSEIQTQAIQNLKVSNMDMKYLVEALLETYRIEQTKIKLNPIKNVKLVELVEDMVGQIEPVALAHNKKINFYACIGREIEVDMDIFLIKRVVQNLVLNALSYSHNSEHIDVSLSIDEGDEGNFTIHVKDYGPGIEKAEIKKIFQKYYSGTSKFLKSGVGLGLYLSNKIVQTHQGKIEVVSEIDKGSTFSIVLPKKIA